MSAALALRLRDYVAREAQNPHPRATPEFRNWINDRSKHMTTEKKAPAKRSPSTPAAKRTTRRKAPADLKKRYANGTDAEKKELLVTLRDEQGLAWWRISEALDLGGTSKQTGKHFGQPARTQYTKYVRPHTESTPNGPVGRPAKAAAEKKPERKAVKATARKPRAAKKSTAEVEVAAHGGPTPADKPVSKRTPAKRAAKKVSPEREARSA